ncbi:MAG: outer membrane protein assembly factor BamA [Candidatus Dasytiphilus stammeri]
MNLSKIIGKIINNSTKKKFFWSLLLVLLFTPKVMGKQNFIVDEIYFQGLQRISVKDASMILPIRKGDFITEEDIKNTIRALFSSRQFDDIQILRENNILILKVQERFLIASIKILGNKYLNTQIITQYLEREGIQEGALFNPYLWNLIEENLENYYYSNGKFTANIKVIVKLLRYHRVGLRIVFNEGKSSLINSINILGNYSFSDKKLKTYLIHQEMISWWKFLIMRRYYSRNKLIKNLKNLSIFYFSRGYGHFYIASTTVFFNPNTTSVDITIIIHEGLRYKINKIIIHNCNFIKKFNLKQKIFLKTGLRIYTEEWFNREKINNLENYLRIFLKQYGYVDPTINTHLVFNDISHSVQVWINIIQGKFSYINKIFFKGNYITDNLFLRHKIGQLEGIRYSEFLVNKSKNILQNTGYLEKINIFTHPVLETDNKVNLIYQLNEITTGALINLGSSYSSEKKLDYHILLHQKNWMGEGYKVNIAAIKNPYKIHAQMTLTNQIFTIKDIKVKKSIFYTNTFRNDNDNLFPEYKYSQKYYGFDENIAYPVWRSNYLNVGIGFIHNELSDISLPFIMWKNLYYLRKNYDLIDRNYPNIRDNNLSFQIGWQFLNLEEKEWSTYGNNTQLHEKFYFPLFFSPSSQIIFDTVQYIPFSVKINNKMIFLVQSHIGYTAGLINNTPSPVFFNFHVGGLSSLRGFKVNSVGPKITYYDLEQKSCKYNNQICVSQDYIGGNIMTIGSIEALIPFKSWLGFMHSSIFIDFGTVFNNKEFNQFLHQPYNLIEESDPNRILVSTGISFKWHSPLGSILLSYSQPLKNNNDDQIEKFQFSVGTNW